MAPPVETDRLRLRQFRPDDLDALADMFADPEQMAFYSHTRTRDEAAEWLERHLRLYEECGYGLWAIEGRADSVFAGYCGIRPLDLDGTAETEIAWRVENTRWNQGVATEAATAVTEIARDRYAISRLTALIPPDHVASRRVAEKIGMREERTTVMDGDCLVVYTLDQRLQQQ
jgi:ribosomal-protein-alanine N-acetyltransferase